MGSSHGTVVTKHNSGLRLGTQPAGCKRISGSVGATPPVVDFQVHISTCGPVLTR